MPVGEWTHVASTWDGKVAILYLDGKEAGRLPLTGTAAASSGALRIGGNQVGSEWFSGLIDEVRIYKRALTAAEIETLVYLLPLVHIEFALSEIDYFAGVLSDDASAALTWDGYLIGHADWFRSAPGCDFLARIRG